MTIDPGTGNGPKSEFGELPLMRGEVAFRLLVEAVQDYAIFLLGPDGRVLTWNLGAQRIKGYAADEIIGQHFSRFYTPEERAVDRPNRLLAWAAEHGRFEDEGWRVRKDGTRFWADVVVTALRDETGTPYAYAKITRDLTERREAEQQQRALLLEQRERAAAEEALQARDRFLSIASHELRTPVATLQLATDSLFHAREHGRLDEPRLETGLKRIATATARLGELMRELLDVSRLTAEGPLLQRAPTDLVSLARDVIDRFAEREGDRVHLAAPEECWIDGDGSRLDQVLTNLVDNALKYSIEPATVDVEIIDREQSVEIRVADRGIGLDAATKDRIFEAFGRGANAEYHQGLGLGLYIAHQIVSRHGGHLDAMPRPEGEGSVFSVVLPRPEGAG